MVCLLTRSVQRERIDDGEIKTSQKAPLFGLMTGRNSGLGRIFRPRKEKAFFMGTVEDNTTFCPIASTTSGL